MKVVILAGGFGTRLSEETIVTPKPMVQIGPHPIIWHIMKGYAAFGFSEFVVALGYKGEVVKDYFLHYGELAGDLTIDLGRGTIEHTRRAHEDWVVHLVDTGLNTLTGGRIKRLAPLIGNQAFMLTYGDGVADVDPRRVLAFHRAHRCLATVTAVRPPARFGGIVFDGDKVVGFAEKRQTEEGWINGGFMVLEPGVLDYLKGDEDVLEVDLLERLAREGQFVAYRHEGFWQCMDTLRDRQLLERMWQSGNAPWKIWDR
jgi:glucose-1-phosphate cytidylyltransferase